MRLLLLELKNVLGLNGLIGFLRQPLILYGENLAGKTNIVNAIRYAFIPKARQPRVYGEEKRVKRDELLIGSQSGEMAVYFEQGKKFYRLEYSFKRGRSRKVRQIQAVYETESVDIPAGLGDTELKRLLDGLSWKRLDVATITGLKEKLMEIKLYPEILDTLIAPSNVRNFSEAVSGRLVAIPKVLEKRISRLHKNAEKSIANLEKLCSILEIEREVCDKRVCELEEDLKKTACLPKKKVEEIFAKKKICQDLQILYEKAKEELEKIPAEVEATLKFLVTLGTKYSRQATIIAEAENALPLSKDIVKVIKEDARLEETVSTLTGWSICLKALPSIKNLEGLVDFEIPSWKRFNFNMLARGEEVKRLFELLESAKKLIIKAREVTAEFDIPLKSREISNRMRHFRLALKDIKKPRPEPSGDDAIVYYSEEEKRTRVSIAVDVLVKNPQYLEGIHPLPFVHRPKKYTSKAYAKFQKTWINVLGTIVKKLNTARRALTEGKKNLKEIKGSLDLLKDEISLAKERKEGNKTKLSKLQDAWKKAYFALCKMFDIKVEKVDLDTAEGINTSVNILGKALEETNRALMEGLKEELKKFPELRLPRRLKKILRLKVTPENIQQFVKFFKERERELRNRGEKQRKLIDWINTHLGEIGELERKRETIEIVYAASVISGEVLREVFNNTDLTAMIERLSDSIKDCVRDACEKILPDEPAKFEYIGKGNFLCTLIGSPITHPGGSHRATISFGIMMALSKEFGLPIILDEAIDRFTYTRLKPFLEYIDAVTSPSGPQIILVIRKSLDIERNPEVLDVLGGWSFYLAERKDVFNKIIRKVERFSEVLREQS